MTVRVAAIAGASDTLREKLAEGAQVVIDWEGPRANCRVNLAQLLALGPLQPLPRDLLDIAAAVYLADIAVRRGQNEQFVRSIELHVPVRRPEFWTEHASDVARILYLLTFDDFRVVFHRRQAAGAPPPPAEPAVRPDSAGLLSGGLDSLAGSVLLLRTGRTPCLISHRSGNPTVEAAQRASVEALREHISPSFYHASITVHPAPTEGSIPYPPPELREPSRRARSFLFIAAAIAAAAAVGASEVCVPENGILTMALPLAPARIGGLSTRSTHPGLVRAFTALARRMGLELTVVNPFLYQTKAELIATVLKPALPVRAIQSTVSCWMAGRRHRQCGGCIPCLLRRLAMLAAGLPDEAYEIALLERPADYVGTDAYTNLVDLLGFVRWILDRSDTEIVLEQPALLDMHAHGVSVPDAVSLLRRFAREVRETVERHFPRAAELLGGAGSGQG